jgi:hypothetical protein
MASQYDLSGSGLTEKEKIYLLALQPGKPINAGQMHAIMKITGKDNHWVVNNREAAIAAGQAFTEQYKIGQPSSSIEGDPLSGLSGMQGTLTGIGDNPMVNYENYGLTDYGGSSDQGINYGDYGLTDYSGSTSDALSQMPTTPDNYQVEGSVDWEKLAAYGISGLTEAYGASKAGEAAGEAAGASLQAQREQLAYLQQINALPQQYREGALKRLAGVAGLEGGEGSQQQLIEQAQQSPLYGALMGGQQAGEEAIMRQASATGGLRSGNVQANLADYSTQLQNQALLQSYQQQLGGLQRLAGLPTGEQQIGQTMADIGQTQASGIQAQGQAFQQGLQGLSTISQQALGDYYSSRQGGTI